MLFATNRKLAAKLSGGHEAEERLIRPVDPKLCCWMVVLLKIEI